MSPDSSVNGGRILRITEGEFRISFVRSSGPGGQNVNKVNTRAVVRFSVEGSGALSDRERSLINRRLAHRLTRSGDIQVSCQRHRTQRANRDEAVLRLLDLLEEAARPPKKRTQTRVPASTKARRLEDKRKRARTKDLRRRPEGD